MNVWFINHYADPPEGMATRPFEIARRLVERGHAVTIFASSFGHYILRDVRPMGWRLFRTEHIDGVRFVWIRTTPYVRNDVWRLLNVITFTLLVMPVGLLRRELPLVVVGTTTHPLAALAGWVLAKAKRARFFFEVTDLWPEALVEFGQLSRSSIGARVLYRLERFLFKRAERIVMMWRNTKEYVTKAGGDATRVVWIPHGVELDRYRSLPPYDGAFTEPFTVVFMGGFYQANAIGTLIEAATILDSQGRQDIRFELVGQGPEKTMWTQIAKQRGLANVTFHAPVPKTRIVSVMARADAFVYGLRNLRLYKYGITLNKLQDYLASKRPIIFYGNSSYDPVREAGAGIAVSPDDPEALAEAVKRLRALPAAERVAMGARGYDVLLRHHLIPTLAAKYDDIFTGQVVARQE